MKFLKRFFIFALPFILLSCRSTAASPTPTAAVQATKGPVGVVTTSVPDVRQVAQAYLDAWKADDYEKMYSLLTPVSKDAVSLDEFTEHYQGIANEAALKSIDYELLSSLVISPESAQVNYAVTLHSVLVGDISRETVMNLSIDKGQWHVQWDDLLVMPELAGGNYLGMERDIPSRANIYDREGKALVAQTDATAVGLRPGLIIEDQAEDLFGVLERLTGLRAETIQERYANFPAGSDWYLPLAAMPADEIQRGFGDLSGLSGLVLTSFRSRFYFDGGVAPHVTGFVSQIQSEEADEYRRLGYLVDERVGRQGLEAWGETYLAGKRGGTLYVYNTQGQPVTMLASQAPKPSQAIYTTLERDYQRQAQLAIQGFRAAAVVLERDTGRVLAMASSPGFDPNAYEPSNMNSYTQLQEIYSNPDNPLLNRATQGQYPLGSVFKIITMSAGLESGDFTPESTYECGYFFTELTGLTLHDWTYDHFLQGDETPPSGILTLPQGLMRSCNPWFWHIGLTLYSEGKTKQISDMARGFGLGSPTGIQGVDEASGQLPDPANEVDAVNLAIGQGSMQVTPLQVANFIAAIGNGGTLYRPQLIEKIAPPDGDPSFVFKPEVRGKLPISQATLQVVRDAMVGVIKNTRPRGTAYHRFIGINIPIAGKTGTATSGAGEPHAWFAGYTFAEREDKPDIAIAVVVENAGEGSDIAAPIFRRLVELYFRGSPGILYPWESSYYVTSTPTPEFSETPAP